MKGPRGAEGFSGQNGCLTVQNSYGPTEQEVEIVERLKEPEAASQPEPAAD